MKRPAAAARMEKQSSIVETEEEETAALTLDIKAGVETLSLIIVAYICCRLETCLGRAGRTPC